MVVKRIKKSEIGDYIFFIVTILILTIISINYIFTINNNIDDSIGNDGVVFTPIVNSTKLVLNNNTKNSICDNLSNIALIQKCEIDNLNCEVGDGDSCYFKKALFYSNVDFCENISNKKTKIDCLETVGYFQIFSGAVLKDNVNLCNKLTLEVERTICEDNYYYSKNFNSRNLSLCNSIKKEVLKNECKN